MRNYTFRHVEGSSASSNTLVAEDHTDFYAKLNIFLAEKPGRSLIQGSIYFSEFGKVPDPPPADILPRPSKVPEFDELGRKGAVQ